MFRDPVVLPVAGVLTAPDVAVDRLVTDFNTHVFGVGKRTFVIPFDFTDYYRQEMGAPLARFWLCGTALINAGELPALKHAARALEAEWSCDSGKRRVNLDPGYISAFQIVLATTKSLPAALYLNRGIYALVELLFHHGRFNSLPWSYADYARAADEDLFLPFRQTFLTLKRGRGL